MKKDGTGWGSWALGSFVEKPCAACKKRGDSCLRVVVDDFGDVDLGACVWCKARSVGCSTAQRRGRGRPSKAKAKEEPKQKRKASEMESESSEGEEPSPKKARSESVAVHSEEEWEEWNGIQEAEEVREEVEEVGEVVEEVRDVTEEVREVTGEVRKVDKEEAKRARKEVRRWERKMRRWERSEDMKDLIHAVIDLGKKVDRFAEEVRVSNVLRNRADREYLEERRRWYISSRMENARGLSDEDSEMYSA
jgi:uncharacterized protein YoxC